MEKEFSDATKRKAFEQLGGCMNCKDTRVSFHHGLPKVMGGDGRKENCIPLCRGKGTNDCHTKADTLTIEHGITIFEIAKEGISPFEHLIYERPRFREISRRRNRRTQPSKRRSSHWKRH